MHLHLFSIGCGRNCVIGEIYEEGKDMSDQEIWVALRCPREDDGGNEQRPTNSREGESAYIQLAEKLSCVIKVSPVSISRGTPNSMPVEHQGGDNLGEHALGTFFDIQFGEHNVFYTILINRQ